ncbi:MAG TPA: hypothetical protein VIP46_09395 [Pyrinomonadaceae bacterium]
MTSKKHRLAIEESLSSALQPPKKRQPSPALNDILSQYAPAPAPAETEQPEIPTPRTPPTPRTLRTTGTPRTHVTSTALPVAPERDFTRVANSIVRDVVPSGNFIGKSKQIYDFLYQRTRGAIVPVRSVTISKPALMQGCGIGSERTLLKNLAHLKGLGLVSVIYTDGKHEGNSYEVFLPEEVGLRTPRTPPTPPTSPTPRHARAEVPPVPPVESGVRGVGSSPIESEIYGESKTLIKTNTDHDDEALADFVSALKKATKEVTGREVSPAERQRWAELADLLVTELKIAAGRTTVSNVPAFFTEHLRRRLWKKEKRQIEAEASDSTETTSARDVDASQCPDCFGTGMWYPEGFEKGVARCRHEKLTSGEPKKS